jgi:hypothetical protein
MSDNKELLPCPFCQHKVVSLHAHSRRTNTAGGYHHFVRCPRCHTEGPRSLLGKNEAVRAWNRRAAQPVVPTDDMRDKVRDAIAAALGEAMDCTRVWSAWSYGTMGPDDFSVVANDDDRLEEIVDAALNAILAAKEQANGI